MLPYSHTGYCPWQCATRVMCASRHGNIHGLNVYSHSLVFEHRLYVHSLDVHVVCSFDVTLNINIDRQTHFMNEWPSPVLKKNFAHCDHKTPDLFFDEMWKFCFHWIFWTILHKSPSEIIYFVEKRSSLTNSKKQAAFTTFMCLWNFGTCAHMALA